MSAALLFFLASFSQKTGLGSGFDNPLEAVLVVLAVVMAIIAFKDRREKRIQRRKKERLIKILEKQKKELKRHFDFQEEPSQKSSLNLIASFEEAVKKEKIVPPSGVRGGFLDNKELILKSGKRSESKRISSETNLARLVVEGEDISTFPPEWQDFFLDNEGKEPLDKLNEMLKI